MAKNDQEEAFERMLTATLNRTVDFVKFGETKNAALLTFSSAWILASVNIRYGNNPIVDANWRIAFALALPLFCASAVIAMISFLPRLKLPKLANDANQEKSLLYFGDIATFSAAAYRERIRTRYFPPPEASATQNYLDDLSTQIAANSKVALRKYTLFSAGSYIVLVALAALVAPAVINVVYLVVEQMAEKAAIAK